MVVRSCYLIVPVICNNFFFSFAYHIISTLQKSMVLEHVQYVPLVLILRCHRELGLLPYQRVRNECCHSCAQLADAHQVLL